MTEEVAFTMIDYLKIWLELKTDRCAVTALEYALIAGVIVATRLTTLATACKHSLPWSLASGGVGFALLSPEARRRKAREPE
jgi:hypothetical protein